MNEDTRQEALESIALIKNLVIQTKKHVGLYGGGWICIIWGVFCFIGIAGQRLLIPPGPLMGVWWTGLAVVAGFATFLVARGSAKTEPIRARHNYMRYFLKFWIPLLLLGYSLATLIALLPSLSNQYISIVMLLVVATGYLIIGLLFYRGMFYMGVIGYIGSITCAVFFLEYSDIILGTLFGVGLTLTGLVINKQWKSTSP